MEMQENTENQPIPKPSLLFLFQHKCPRCRRGDMFESPTVFSTNFMKMKDTCAECGQHFDLEPGFYYGSSYVSYGLTVALSVATFVAWWVLIGFSIDDNRIFYWLGVNAFLLIVLQPYLMRFSRTLWLSFFVKYDPYWKNRPAARPERKNEAHTHAW